MTMTTTNVMMALTVGVEEEVNTMFGDMIATGQGIGTIKNAPPVKEVVDRMVEEYQTMKTKLAV